jgi:hypothetical protein
MMNSVMRIAQCRRGLSLIELTVSVGLMSLLMMAGLELVALNQRIVKSITLGRDLDDLSLDIYRTLQSADVCRTNFQIGSAEAMTFPANPEQESEIVLNSTLLPLTASGGRVLVPELNTVLPQTTLLLESARFIGFVPIGDPSFGGYSRKYSAALLLNWRMQGSETLPTRFTVVNLNLDLDPDGRMIGCQAKSQNASQILRFEYTGRVGGASLYTLGLPTGFTRVRIHAWGGGGSGGRGNDGTTAGGGGGAGAYVFRELSQFAGDDFSFGSFGISVGWGGSNGNNGGPTSVSKTLGGEIFVEAAGGVQGPNVGGTTSESGSADDSYPAPPLNEPFRKSFVGESGSSIIPGMRMGRGGSAYQGGAGAPVQDRDIYTEGFNGEAPGGGGGPTYGGNRGGHGGPGKVIIEFYRD